ncbi:MAG: Uma2 family endonuclease, partial [Bacteroidota bacterium]
LQTKNGVRSPTVLVEVVSRSSSQYDHGFKMREYFKLPSLQHYLIVAQSLCWVQQYTRKPDGGWDFSFYDQLDQRIPLPELDLELSLSDVYRRVEFGPEISAAEEAAMQYQGATATDQEGET